VFVLESFHYVLNLTITDLSFGFYMLLALLLAYGFYHLTLWPSQTRPSGKL